MDTNSVNRDYEKVAKVFARQYNLAKGTQYEFEYPRKSIFTIPKYRIAGIENYVLAFMEGRKQNRIITDLMVMTRLKKRLIIEVVKLQLLRRTTKEQRPLSNLIADVVGSLERAALNGAVCSQCLLVDGRGFGRVEIGSVEIYRKPRLQREQLLREAQKRDEGTRSQVVIPAKHWFREIWLLCRNKKGIVRCLQMW